MPALIEIRNGKRFGLLKVKRLLPERKRGYAVYSCLCKCHMTTNKTSAQLLRTQQPACARCAAKLKSEAGRRLKAAQDSPEYRIWIGLKRRCLDSNGYWHQIDRQVYGPLSTTMEPAWLESFATFRRDMGRLPKGCCIDRRERTKGWTRGNTVWRTTREFLTMNQTSAPQNCGDYLRGAMARAAA